MLQLKGKKDAGKEGRSKSGLGHLEGLRNNTNPKWWLDPALRKLHFMLMMIAFCQITNGYDGSLINNLQSLSTWKESLHHPDANMLGVFGALQVVGGFIACFWASPIADRFGRRYSMLAGGLMIVAAGPLQGFSYSQAQYIIGRVFAGAGNVTAIVGAASLNNELAHPRTRPYITGCYNVIWYVGAVVAAWLCYGLRIQMPTSEWQWRIPSILISFWGFIMIGLFLTIPESPRWLMAKGRDEEAAAILYRLHANGDTSDELVHGEIMEIRAQLDLEKQQKRVSKSWKECFSTPGDRWRMFICIGFATCIGWTGQSIVSYYNTQILTQAGITETLPQLGINGGLTIFDLFTSMFGAWLSGRIGRRPLFLISFGGMTAAHLVVTILSARYAATKVPGLGYAIIAFIWVESGLYNIALNPLSYAYTSEILSFSTRTKGLALYLFTQEWQAIITRYVNPIGLANLGWKYYIVFQVFYVLETLFVYLYFPETKGRTLEEIAEIFDGTTVANQVLNELEVGHVVTENYDSKAEEAGEERQHEQK
ncbi:hypothetical protein I302_107923 [Kwoniella bestiolae CBS 10118]|uniref:Major facilitator superfamily (MFS) profile domain-containing protein n=1 Tax=Kwoniella bestiolae CBS 10118 TaxID=1296100 RepID=A0A1B9FX61_9TREE|nr:hypothetical protein I302_07712 [Kwoniella bestiolae CBS 10118]OCF23358.1 hypothetical protein I302_07712 [Kwoniella bestiolae CBS 10118]